MLTPSNFRRRLDSLSAGHRLARLGVKREKQALAEARERAEHTLIAQRLVQEVAERIQSEAHQKIASVVTHCLKSVFGPEGYEFRINFVKARGKTEAHLQFVRGGVVIEDPLNEAGGGVIDIAAFALRIACLSLGVPRRRKLLVLDEPFRFVHGEANRERAASLLETLAADLGVQIILATGLEWLKIGKIVEIGGQNDDD